MIKQSVLILLGTLAATVSASQIGIRVMNSDARVVITPADESIILADTLVKNGVQLDLTVKSYPTLKYKIKPNSAIFGDTTVTVTGVQDYWNSPITVVPPQRTLSADSAYIPLRSNVKATVTVQGFNATGGMSNPSTYKLEAGQTVVAALPLSLKITDLQEYSPIAVNFAIGFKQRGGIAHLTLPAEFLNGTAELANAKGQIVGSMNLTALAGNSLSVWNAGSGTYFIRLKSITGSKKSFKIIHPGGDCKILSSFAPTGVTSVHAPIQSRNVRSEPVNYRFQFAPESVNYPDSTIDREVIGKANVPLTVIYREKADSGRVLINQYMDTLLFNELFPHRIGVGLNAEKSFGDYFSLANLQKAIDTLSQYTAQVYRKADVPVGDKWVVTNRKKKTTYTYITNADYNRGTAPEVPTTIDYATFLSQGTTKERLYELVSFLANISQETNGRYESDLVPDKGLYFKEEHGLDDNTVGRYFSADATYPAVSTVSYHGRGPKQLSYNYNYGQFSDFYYGDKNVLLNNPKVVSHDPIVSFASALWFWMTPQGIKPSCHDVMVGNWKPSSVDISKGRDKSLFGMTINVINGGVECGGNGEEVQQVKNRVDFLKRYSKYFWIEPESYCGCAQMQNFNQ